MGCDLFRFAAFAGLLAGAVGAQEVPFDERHNLDDAPFYLNQIDTFGDLPTFAVGCRGEVMGPAYFYTSDTSDLPWDGAADPGERYLAEDPCGLRNTDLSGVLSNGAGSRYVASHDPRSGAFTIRRLYVRPDAEPRATWGSGLGNLLFEGRIHAEELWLDFHSVFPPSIQSNCPDQYQTVRHAAAVRLNYVAAGRYFELEVDVPRLHIDGSCNVTFLEKNVYSLYQMELEQ
jgi:hypothetical protein